MNEGAAERLLRHVGHRLGVVATDKHVILQCMECSEELMVFIKSVPYQFRSGRPAPKSEVKGGKPGK